MGAAEACMLNPPPPLPYTPQGEPPILSTLPEPLAAQLLGEMLRLKSRESQRQKETHVDIPARAYGLLQRTRH